jgi:DNA-binding NtrC family response regulator
LRVREDDIDLLADFFLEHFKRQSGRKALKLGKQARDLIRTYPWPGNVRQLRNVIDSAVVLAEGQEIRPEDLTLHEVNRSFHQSHTPLTDHYLNPSPAGHSPSPTTLSLKTDSPEALVELFDTLNVEVWEQRLIQAALKRTQGNIPAAAEIMGMSRATLYRKLERGPNSNPSAPS